MALPQHYVLQNLAPKMWWHTDLRKRLLSLPHLQLGLHLGLEFRNPQSSELQACCSYKRCAKGNTRLPQHGSLSTILLGTNISPNLIWLFCLGLGLGFRKPQSTLQLQKPCQGAQCIAPVWVPPHLSLWCEPCACHVNFRKRALSLLH